MRRVITGTILGLACLLGFGAFASGLARAQTSPAAVDLTPFQWAYSNTGRTFATSGEDGGTNLEALGWNNAEQPLRSAGTVAILSTGIDETHPDLEGALLDMTPFTDEGAVHGVNAHALARGDGDAADIDDDEGTGTHCAGIIAAAWDGSGTSGLSNTTKVIAIKVTDDEGAVSSDAVVAAYEYLGRAMDNGLVLTAICNPWPVPHADADILAAVNELGSRGAISIFAAGDEGLDLDQERLSASEASSAPSDEEDAGSPLDVATRDDWVSDSPYAVVVGSAGADGSCSWFSNTGVQTTDVFAPGEEILAPAPESVGMRLPEADESALLLETFADGEEGTVRAHAIVDATALGQGDLAHALGDVVGSFEEEIRFDGLQESGGALEIEKGDLAVLAQSDDGGAATLGIALLLALPKDADIADVPVTIHAFTTRASQDAPARISARMLATGGGGGPAWTPEGAAGSATTSGCIGTTWGILSFTTADALSAIDGGEPLLVDGDGDGTAESLCVLLAVENAAGPLYLDTIGVGAERAPYAYRSGTAQAAAYVAGATSVLWPRIGGSIGGADRAAALIDALRQASTPSEKGSLSGLCYFGGELDLGRLDQIAFPGTTSSAGEAGTEASSTVLSSFGFFRILIGLLVVSALVVSASLAAQRVRGR